MNNVQQKRQRSTLLKLFQDAFLFFECIRTHSCRSPWARRSGVRFSPSFSMRNRNFVFHSFLTRQPFVANSRISISFVCFTIVPFRTTMVWKGQTRSLSGRGVISFNGCCRWETFGIRSGWIYITLHPHHRPNGEIQRSKQRRSSRTKEATEATPRTPPVRNPFPSQARNPIRFSHERNKESSRATEWRGQPVVVGRGSAREWEV